MAVVSTRDAPTKLRYWLNWEELGRMKDAPVNPDRFGGVVEAPVNKSGAAYSKMYDHVIVDGRVHNGGLSSWKIEEHGFCYIQAPSPVSDFTNPKLVSSEYGPRAAEAVRKACGAKEAIFMSHMRRWESAPNTGQGGYARVAHSDYGPYFEPLMRRTLVARYGMPEEEANSCGLCIVNMWAPIDRPAFKDPLAVLDCSSIDMEKETIAFISSGNLGYPEGYKGGGDPKKLPVASQDAPALAPTYNAKHRWVYLSDMTPAEALIFKQYDFRTTSTTKCSFHHSFPDKFHDDWKECPGRRSIECRFMLIFDNNDQNVASKL